MISKKSQHKLKKKKKERRKGNFANTLQILRGKRGDAEYRRTLLGF